MNKLNMFESLNNAIAREYSILNLEAMQRDFVLSKFYERKKSYGMVHINFGSIYIPDTSYLNGKIETKYHVDIYEYDISHIRYEGQDKLNLKKLNFLGIGEKEIWEIGGVVRDKSSHIHKLPIGENYHVYKFFRNKYRFSINEWIVPKYSYLILTKSWNSPKNDMLGVFIDFESFISFKYCDIFNLERVER